jgi:hypothetical protein
MPLNFLPLKLKNLDNKQINFIKKDKIYFYKKNKFIKWYLNNAYNINKLFNIIYKYFEQNNIQLNLKQQKIYYKFVYFCYYNSI